MSYRDGLTPEPIAPGTFKVTVAQLQSWQQALAVAHRLSGSLDAVQSALGLAERPEPGALTRRLSTHAAEIARLLAPADVVVPGRERPLLTGPASATGTTPEVAAALSGARVRQIMTGHGWTAAVLVCGSSQIEAMARRIVHTELPPPLSVAVRARDASSPLGMNYWYLEERVVTA